MLKFTPIQLYWDDQARRVRVKPYRKRSQCQHAWARRINPNRLVPDGNGWRHVCKLCGMCAR